MARLRTYNRRARRRALHKAFEEMCERHDDFSLAPSAELTDSSMWHIDRVHKFKAGGRWT